MKILITGSTGLVGKALVPFLRAKGHQVIKLIRDKNQASDDAIYWDPKKGIIPIEELEGFDAVIHLAGKNIATRWTDEAKREILQSRVQDTEQLARALCKLQKAPKVFICASAVGIYGNRNDEILTESSTAGTGFLAEVCKEWENAAALVKQCSIRCVHTRFGIILSPKGGMLAQMIPPFRFGLGVIMGKGDQVMSWIAIEDVISAINHCLVKEELMGGVNFTAPYPETNASFSQKLSSALHRPLFLRIGEKPLRFVLGEMADEMLLSSTKAKPEKLLLSGYDFIYPTLESYLSSLFLKV